MSARGEAGEPRESGVDDGGLHLVRRGVRVTTGDGELVAAVSRRPLSRFGEFRRSFRGQTSVKDLVVTLDVSRPDGSPWFVFDKPKRAKAASVTLADEGPVGTVRPHTGWAKVKSGGANRLSLVTGKGPELVATRPAGSMTFTIAGLESAPVGEVTARLTPVGGVAGTGLGGGVELWDEMRLAPGINEPARTLCIAFLVGYHCLDSYRIGYPPKWG
jgi:hypothetical protein